ncbi:MAG TPA: NTP transferase domain-containing protein, partial [Thermodesulfobacteriota bacterium]|nr:NTP transferase domain-containing protein [Thermodesulfobacteriota bacterium]
MGSLAVVILAAGKGTRMKSDQVKVLHLLAGSPMISCTLDAARSLQPARLIVVVGFQAEAVKQAIQSDDVSFAEQREQLGTGHAVLTAAPHLRDFQGTVLIISGDVPLLTEKTLKTFAEKHAAEKAVLSVLTVKIDDPRGYGRVFRDSQGMLLRIVEDRDLRPGEERVDEINTGIYCADCAFLLDALNRLSADNAQKEYYLTDIVARASSTKQKVIPVLADETQEVMGINNRAELA